MDSWESNQEDRAVDRAKREQEWAAVAAMSVEERQETFVRLLPGDPYPSHICDRMGICHSTPYYWAEDNTEVAQAIKLANKVRHRMALEEVDKAISGEVRLSQWQYSILKDRACRGPDFEWLGDKQAGPREVRIRVITDGQQSGVELTLPVGEARLEEHSGS